MKRNYQNLHNNERKKNEELKLLSKFQQMMKFYLANNLKIQIITVVPLILKKKLQQRLNFTFVEQLQFTRKHSTEKTNKSKKGLSITCKIEIRVKRVHWINITL